MELAASRLACMGAGFFRGRRLAPWRREVPGTRRKATVIVTIERMDGDMARIRSIVRKAQAGRSTVESRGHRRYVLTPRISTCSAK